MKGGGGKQIIFVGNIYYLTVMDLDGHGELGCYGRWRHDATLGISIIILLK